VFPARIFNCSTGRLEIDTACSTRKPFSMFWATYPPNQLFTTALLTTQPSLYTSLLQRTACTFWKLATQPSGPPAGPHITYSREPNLVLQVAPKRCGSDVQIHHVPIHYKITTDYVEPPTSNIECIFTSLLPSFHRTYDTYLKSICKRFK
jgi:hypothetical protein